MDKRFNSARKHAKLTLVQIRLRSSCPISMLSELSKGGRMPRVDSVERIARALGVSAGWLAYGEGTPPDWWVAEKKAEAEAMIEAEKRRRRPNRV